MARVEGEPKSFKEKVQKYGLIAGIGGGLIFLISASGLALAVGLGGGGAYFGAKSLEGKGK